MKLGRLITRRRAKWVGFTTFVAAFCAFVASTFYEAQLHVEGRGSSFDCAVRFGGLEVSWCRLWTIEPLRRIAAFSGPRLRNFRIEPWFDWGFAPRGWGFKMPLWLPVVLIAAPTVYLWRTDRRAKPWQCAKCRYDLRGLEGGGEGGGNGGGDKIVCPECGTVKGEG